MYAQYVRRAFELREGRTVELVREGRERVLDLSVNEPTLSTHNPNCNHYGNHHGTTYHLAKREKPYWNALWPSDKMFVIDFVLA